MSKESAKEFLEKMKHDDGLRTRMSAAESPEKRWEIIRAEGFHFTGEEFDSCRDEISEEELDTISGGMCKACYWLRR
jgi:predicted ribosomally synthesized peptide with nif11-like leader